MQKDRAKIIFLLVLNYKQFIYDIAQYTNAGPYMNDRYYRSMKIL